MSTSSQLRSLFLTGERERERGRRKGVREGRERKGERESLVCMVGYVVLPFISFRLFLAVGGSN